MTKTTEIIFLLDCSGSMSGREDDTVGGYNAFLKSQRELPGAVRVTTALFDDKYQLLYNGVPLNEAFMQPGQYFTRGMTALYDAVGRTIQTVAARHAKMSRAQRPHTIFVITTDGYENASTRFSLPKLRELIARQRRVQEWEFIFLGADIDSEAVAASMDIPAPCALAYRSNEESFSSSAKRVSEMVCEMRLAHDAGSSE